VRRALTSRSPLQRVEAGDPAVSAGIYAAVLQTPGLLEGLGQVADRAALPLRPVGPHPLKLQVLSAGPISPSLNMGATSQDIVQAQR
jgi:hypothetical protein